MSNLLLCCTNTHVLVPIYIPQTLTTGICLHHLWLRAGWHTLFRGPTWGNSVSQIWQLKSRERIGGREGGGVHEGEWTRKAELPCDHISSVCPAAHLDLRRISTTRPLITINVTATMVCSWIWSFWLLQFPRYRFRADGPTSKNQIKSNKSLMFINIQSVKKEKQYRTIQLC